MHLGRVHSKRNRADFIEFERENYPLLSQRNKISNSYLHNSNTKKSHHYRCLCDHCPCLHSDFNPQKRNGEYERRRDGFLYRKLWVWGNGKIRCSEGLACAGSEEDRGLSVVVTGMMEKEPEARSEKCEIGLRLDW